MRKFRIHRKEYYCTDMFDAPPYATLLETHATWCVQMRILWFWVTIREFDFDSEKHSQYCAKRLLAEIKRF